VQAIRADVEDEIKAGLEFAQESAAPQIDELTRDVYTGAPEPMRQGIAQ
jgi:pyruvate dehydrogenase E1 component alpha subunit